MRYSRRGVLKGIAALAGAGAVAACTSVTKNGVTTISLNVAEIDNYAQAGLSAEQMIMSIAPIAALIPAPIATAITTDTKILVGALDSFKAATKGLLTVDYDNTDWNTRVNSVLSSIQTVESDLVAALKSVDGKVSVAFTIDANTALSALSTLIAFFKAEIGYLGAEKDAKMSKDQAFKILGIKAPL